MDAKETARRRKIARAMRGNQHAAKPHKMSEQGKANIAEAQRARRARERAEREARGDA